MNSGVIAKNENMPDVEGKSKSVILYCVSEFCRGIPSGVEYDELDESECPVCYDNLLSGVTQLQPCGHSLCSSCTEMFKEFKNGCPVCRGAVERILYLNAPLKKNIAFGSHDLCHFNDPLVNEYYENLGNQWKRLVGFMFRTQSPYSFDKFGGVKGLCHLDLSQYEDRGRLIRKNESSAVIKGRAGKESVIIACLLPSLSITFIISPNDETHIEVDNSYVDEIVEYIDIQLETCYRMLSQIIPRKNDLCHLYVRKFEQFTGKLLLFGYCDGNTPKHETPMRQQLQDMKKCNFDEKHYERLRKTFPPLDLDNMDIRFRADKNYCDCYQLYPPFV